MHALQSPKRQTRLSQRLTKMPATRPLSLLLVDDTASDRRETIALLDAGGRETRIHECDSGLAALNVLRRTRIDVVLIDYRLPDMDGLELVSAIAEMADDTAVILLSDQASGRVAADAIKYGAKDYVDRRDLDAASLEDAIEVALRTARLEWNTSLRFRQMRYDQEVSVTRMREASRQVHAHIAELDQSIDQLEGTPTRDTLSDLVAEFRSVQQGLHHTLKVLGTILPSPSGDQRVDHPRIG